jgi:1-acyl-sn-glycerol-3-phosphate acyltransferase
LNGFARLACLIIAVALLTAADARIAIAFPASMPCDGARCLALGMAGGAVLSGIASLPLRLTLALAALARLVVVGALHGLAAETLPGPLRPAVAALWGVAVGFGIAPTLAGLRDAARAVGLRMAEVNGAALLIIVLGSFRVAVLGEARTELTYVLCLAAMATVLPLRAARVEPFETTPAEGAAGVLPSLGRGLTAWDTLAPALSLLALAAYVGMMLGMGRSQGWFPGDEHLLAVMGLFPFAIGCVVVGLAGHPFRMLGWTFYGWLGLAIGPLLYADTSGGEAFGLIAFFAGVVAAPSVARLQIALPPRGRSASMGLCFGLAVLVAAGVESVALPSTRLLPFLLALAGAGVSLWLFGRATLEFTAALPALLLFRVHATGPGVKDIPWRGPVLLIANHAAWFDPLWLGKIVPRRLTPMMTSKFFDLPVLRWLMPHMGVIRVRDDQGTIRHEAPELLEAAARLAHGECVLIFPEGYLRRTEEQVMRRFGQGVWRILQEQPHTPVVPCWIEGSWGSYLSFKNGLPGTGKPFDWFRRITIVVGKPLLVPADALADHRATRAFLEREVLALRMTLPGMQPFADSWQRGEEDSIPPWERG